MEMALMQLMVWVEKVLDQQEIALDVFLGNEGALYNTSSDFMCAALFKHGVAYTIVWWIIATLEGYIAVATLSGFSKRFAVPRGCPQGGVLLPLI
jgi:hypothetical protein